MATPEELAAQYGWSAAIISAIPEVKGLFDRAVAENWTPEKFQMEVRNTGWYRTNGEAARSTIALRASDPATWASRQGQVYQTILDRAAQMGATITRDEALRLADSYMMFGWNDANLANAMTGFIKVKNGSMTGAAGAALAQLKEYARSMGVNVSENWLTGQAAKIAGGRISSDTALASLRNTAASAWPQFKDRIQAGETMAEIADPYVQQMAKTLEISPEQLSIFDRTIRGALSAKDDKGKPTMKSIWEFEQDLRKDTRWRRTQNAQDEGGQIINALGKMFGKVAD